MAVGIEHIRLDTNLHAAETRARLGFALSRCARAIHHDVGVMHITLVARTNLDCLHPSRFLNWQRENKVPVTVSALRGECQRLRSSENQIGLAQSPAFDKFRQ